MIVMESIDEAVSTASHEEKAAEAACSWFRRAGQVDFFATMP